MKKAGENEVKKVVSWIFKFKKKKKNQNIGGRFCLLFLAFFLLALLQRREGLVLLELTHGIRSLSSSLSSSSSKSLRVFIDR